MHALWNCEKFQQVWAKNFGQVDRDKAASGSFSDLVKLIQDKPQTVPLFEVTAWAIWYQKKKSHLQKASLSLDRITNFAKQYLHDFKSSENTPAQTRLLSLRKWSPLASGYFKTNFDGAMFDEADLGMVIRNFEGVVMVALSEEN